MFNLAMKRGFVAEGKFSINKSRSFHDVVVSTLSPPRPIGYNDISCPCTSKNILVVSSCKKIRFDQFPYFFIFRFIKRRRANKFAKDKSERNGIISRNRNAHNKKKPGKGEEEY